MLQYTTCASATILSFYERTRPGGFTEVTVVGICVEETAVSGGGFSVPSAGDCGKETKEVGNGLLSEQSSGSCGGGTGVVRAGFSVPSSSSGFFS